MRKLREQLIRKLSDMFPLATGSDIPDEDYFPDMDLINDLETSVFMDAALPDIYHQQIVTNELLALIFALLICFTIFGIAKAFYQLLVHNIFKHL